MGKLVTEEEKAEMKRLFDLYPKLVDHAVPLSDGSHLIPTIIEYYHGFSTIEEVITNIRAQVLIGNSTFWLRVMTYDFDWLPFIFCWKKLRSGRYLMKIIPREDAWCPKWRDLELTTYLFELLKEVTEAINKYQLKQ